MPPIQKTVTALQTIGTNCRVISGFSSLHFLHCDIYSVEFTVRSSFERIFNVKYPQSPHFSSALVSSRRYIVLSVCQLHNPLSSQKQRQQQCQTIHRSSFKRTDFFSEIIIYFNLHFRSPLFCVVCLHRLLSAAGILTNNKQRINVNECVGKRRQHHLHGKYILV